MERSAARAPTPRLPPDAPQIISFLRRDAERKDELIESLKSTIKQQREMFSQEREQEKAEMKKAMKEMEKYFRKKIEDLQVRLDDSEEGLKGVLDYKEKREQYVANMRECEEARQEEAGGHAMVMEAMERKFFEEKGRLQKEYKQMLAEMKKTSQEEAVERLDSSTKKILFENRRMAEELRLQVRESDDLQSGNKRLEDDNRRLRREVALNEQARATRHHT